MKVKVVKWVVLTLLLMNMLGVVFNIPFAMVDVDLGKVLDENQLKDRNSDKLNLSNRKRSSHGSRLGRFESNLHDRDWVFRGEFRDSFAWSDWDFDELANANEKELEPEFMPGEVIVKFRENLHVGLKDDLVNVGIDSIDELNEQFRATKIEKVFSTEVDILSNIYKLTLPRDADILSIASEYDANPYIEYAEPNYVYHFFVVPNDKFYTLQWAHQNMQSELAWDIETGDPNVVIAVADSGVDWDHPDLAMNVWSNVGEVVDEVDNDGNGYVDDVRGWDFFENDSDPMDDLGHGTHCAGIAAAATNNSIGIAGTTWKSKIMPLRIGNASGIPEVSAAEAISYAADNGADILSMSWGNYGQSALIYEAIKYAYDNGVLLVAAAGNDATPEKLYPAAYEEVIAVTATDQFDNPTWFTNFGNWVELAAPGYWIYSTLWNNSYGYMSGTSMSTPHVAGVAALIWSIHPFMSRDQVRVHLGYTADDLGDQGFDQFYGYGRVNAGKAFEQLPLLPEHDLLIYDLEKPICSQPGALLILNTTILNFGVSNETDATVQMLVDGELVDWQIVPSIASGNSTTVGLLWVPIVEGIFNITSYVVPVLDETNTQNNAVSASVHAKWAPLLRPAVFIWGDSDLATYADGGSGSAQDPYIIGWWSIDTEIYIYPYGYAGIFVIDTQAYFVMRNVHVRGVQTGILFINVRNGAVENSVIESNFFGVELRDTTDTIIIGNYIVNNGFGLYLDSSYDVTLIDNDISYNGGGLILSDSSYVTMGQNRIDDNVFGFNVYGYCFGGFMWIDESNTINNKPIHYLFDLNDCVIDSSLNASFLWLVDSNNVTVQDLDLDGLILENTNNALVQNVHAERSFYGMVFFNSHDNIIKGNSAQINYMSGINLVNAVNNTITANIVLSSWTGIGLTHMSGDGAPRSPFIFGPWGNIVDGNYISSCFCSIMPVGTLEAAGSFNTISENTITYSEYGMRLPFSRYSSLRNNTITYTACSLYLVYFDNGTVRDNTIISSTYGMFFASDNGTVRDNTIISSTYGMFFASDNGTVRDNTIISSTYGIYLYYAYNNTLTSNNLASNLFGLVVDAGTHNTGTGNNIVDNDHGILLNMAENNFIGGNKITNNTQTGIELDYGSSANNIVGNYIADNMFSGIKILNGSRNFIYHNDFVDNTQQAYVSLDSLGNVWDNGYPSGGNHWSDYTGEDLDEDGIGDTAYIIDDFDRDNFPLMNAWPFHDAAIINVAPSKTVVGQGFSMRIDVTVVNQGDLNEILDVLLFATNAADEFLIDWRSIDLTIRELTTIKFTWNTAGFANDEYTLTAYVTPVPDETDIADNTYTDGMILVTIPGDVNGDRIVDIFDIGVISAHWYPGPPMGPLGYDANADINDDGAVDIFDVGIVSYNWGESW